MLHVDIKKLVRFEAPGHRVTNSPVIGRSEGAGRECLFVALDDHSRMGFVGIYPDETKHTAADFLDIAPHTMARMGAPVRRVLIHNAKCFASDLPRATYERHHACHRNMRS